MNLTELYEMRQISPESLQHEIDLLESELDQLSANMSLNEEHNMSDEVAAKLVKAQEKLAAAKRGMGIVNKLSAGDSKVKHAKRVMANINKLRGEVSRLKKMLKQHEQSE